MMATAPREHQPPLHARAAVGRYTAINVTTDGGVTSRAAISHVIYTAAIKANDKRIHCAEMSPRTHLEWKNVAG